MIPFEGLVEYSMLILYLLVSAVILIVLMLCIFLLGQRIVMCILAFRFYKPEGSSHYHWMKRQNSLGNRELSEDLARFSPEIETFRKYTPPFECALDIMGVSHVSSHLFSKKIISFHLHSSENISSRLLTREILRLLHVKHSQRHNFRKLITCLNSLEDPSGTITEIEHHYFSLIHMKLSEKYKIFPRLEGNCFLVTIYLSLLDDRVEDAISSSDTLCVKLELNDQKTCRTNSEVSENKGAISITLVNFIDSDLSGPLYEVANVNSSKPGCLELELLLFHPHTLNLVSHN